MHPYDFDIIKISYCRQHKLYWIQNCPDCMAETYLKEGIRGVVEWIESVPTREIDGAEQYVVTLEQWQAKLKEWGIDHSTETPNIKRI